jgi:hypothetical protein
MDTNHFPGSPIIATVYSAVSVVCGIFASIANVEIYVRLTAGLAAIVAAFFAARYHYYATKEKINSTKTKTQNNG